MGSKENCGENGGITNRAAEKENCHCHYNRNKEEKHNKKQTNELLEDEMVEEQCEQIIEKKKRTQPTAIPLIYRLRKGV